MTRSAYNLVAIDSLRRGFNYVHGAVSKIDNLARFDPLGKVTNITPNTAGQPVSIKDPLNNETLFSYVGGDLFTVTDPLGNVTTRFTDAARRVRSISNPLGQVTLYDFDPLNRLTKITDPLAGLTEFTYDENSNLKTVKEARTNVTEYFYNNMDRLEKRKDPLLREEIYNTYDQNGNLLQFTDRKNQVTTYEYDPLNRRKKVTYAGVGSTTDYVYDAGNRPRQILDSLSGNITRDYDDLDRLILETTPQGNVSYTYDTAGRRTGMTASNQTPVLYPLYDNANRIKRIEQGSAVVLFNYDDAGRRTSLTLPNGVLVEYGYDIASRLTSISYKQSGTNLLGNLTYEYDKAGNRTKVGGTWARTGIPQAVSTSNYNAANHQLAFGDKAMTFDNNGNLQTIADASGTTVYTWNSRSQLTNIGGPVTASFVYDGAGRREKKTINGTLTEFLYDGLNPVQESSGTPVTANILTGLGIDEFFTRSDISSGVTSSFLTDALGSTLALANASGTVQTEYKYEPFGNTTVTGATNTNSFQHTGRENDATGLYDYRARSYYPGLQRFLSEDPISFTDQSLNLFAFVRNSPANFVDPLGLYVGGVGVGVSAADGTGLGGQGFVGFVHDSQGNRGFAICGALGAATGGGIFGGIVSINNWGAKSIKDLEGIGTGLGVGGGGSGPRGPTISGGWGVGAFLEVALGANLKPTGINTGIGIGFGGMANYFGFGGCIVFPKNNSTEKSKQ